MKKGSINRFLISTLTIGALALTGFGSPLTVQTATAANGHGPIAAMATRGSDQGETLYPGLGRASTKAPIANQSIVYNGGPLMTGPTNLYVIWYGAWNDPNRLKSSSGESIITDYLAQVGPSNRNAINAAYKFGTLATSTNVVFQKSVVVSSASTFGNALGATGVSGIVNYTINNGSLSVDPNGIYFVLTSAGISETSSPGATFLGNYCGYHSYLNPTAAPTVALKYSFVGDPTGPSLASCNGNSSTASPNGNVGVDAMISVIQHELEETMTDPQLNAFWDSASGSNTQNENADICAWDFGPPMAGVGYNYNMTLGSRKFYVQRNWYPGTTSSATVPAKFTGGSCAMALPTSPTITSFTPASASRSDTVTLTGTNMYLPNTTTANVKSVLINGQSASFTIKSATSIDVIVPAGATSGSIQLISASGTATSDANLTVTPMTVTALNPSFGPVGTLVTITGTQFTGATSVKFNNVAAVINLVTATSITAIVPVGATSGLVTITTTKDSATSATLFAVTTASAPTITSISTTSGFVGDSVIVYGTNFTGATSVTFNGTTATSFTVDSDTQISVVVPAGATTGSLKVVTPNGGWVASNFTVNIPTVTGFTPTSGSPGASIVITGTNFIGVTGVFLNGVSAVPFTVTSPTSITATAPATGSVGKVSVVTASGSAISTGNFTYSVSSFSSFSPASGARGTQVVISGTNLANTSSVLFNGVAATSFSATATSVSATVPNAATTGKITVVTPGGSYSSSTNYSVTAPTLASFTQAVTPGSTVSISGSNLIGVTGVTFNLSPATFTVFSPTQISAVVPSGVTAGNLLIVSPSGTVKSSGSFTVVLPPTLTGFTALSGAPGTVVSLTGSNFTGATKVLFNGKQAATFTVTSSTKISATVPTGATTGPISVTAAGGTVSSLNNFSVTAPAAPTGATFAPISGGPGTNVTVTGANFTGATSVTIGSVNIPVFKVVSSTSLVFGLPAGAATGKITVTTPGGTVTSASTFTVNTSVALPTITSITPSSGAAGTTVTINGTNLAGVSSVKFAGISAVFVIVGSTRILAAAPSGGVTGTIAVTQAGGTATSLSYTYNAVLATPTLSGISFGSGSAGGTVTLTGTNLIGVTGITLNGTVVTSLQILSATQVSFVIPPGASTGLIQVTTSGGTVAYSTPFVVY